MPTKKRVTFANNHGKSLSETKHIDKVGKSAKVEHHVRKQAPAYLDKESMEIRRKKAEYATGQQVKSLQKEIDKTIGLYKNLNKLIKDSKNNTQLFGRIMETKKTLDKTREQLEIDLDNAMRKLKAQKKLG